VKSRLNDLDRMVNERTAELQQANDRLKEEIAERLQMERALRLSEERFSKAFRASPIPLAIQTSSEEKFVDVNQGFEEITGFSRSEMIGRTPAELRIWADSVTHRSRLSGGTQVEVPVRNKPFQLRTRSGQIREILVSVELFELDGESFILSIAQDISEQIRLENQLRQSQKMEAMGQLAAGVAHDFNNILTVVQGYTSLLVESKSSDADELKHLQTIALAADRAAKLVRQLLTFSRKQFMEIRPLNIRITLSSVSDMLARLVGEHIKVEVTVPPDLPTVHADAAMMEQMLINLAVNARDAMPGGGTLVLSAANVDVDAAHAERCPEARAGSFLCLSVADNGCGIQPDVLPRIFEPFFTTKGIGKGTGLGLATVYGIVKQHQGWIEVESQPGCGCTFRIYIPSVERKLETRPAPLAPLPSVGGHEAILVAEDEENVRSFVVQILKTHGYRVFAASSGVEALEQWPGVRGEVDLLITDLVMPGGLSGRELAERLLRENPALKVIFTSGYSPGIAGTDLGLLDGRNFLPKPYGPALLLQMVRTCLDQRPLSN
jgi:PAS domain S-box-containing protein